MPCLCTVITGPQLEDRFLVDGGADCTVLSAELIGRLGLSGTVGSRLAGVGGTEGSALVQTTLEFKHDAGGTAVVRGEFSAFTNPGAIVMNILGRDVLNNFDVIMSRPRNEILLLSPPHRYVIHSN